MSDLKKWRRCSIRDRILDGSCPEPNSGCWLWTRSVNRFGHGKINIGGTITPAHRVSWVEFRGAIPDGMFVCHKCDTASCTNPDHLYLGTQRDNMRDVQLRHRSGRIGSARWTRPRRGRWQARVSIHGKEVHLGTYDTQDEAHKAASAFVYRDTEPAARLRAALESAK